MNSSYGQTLEKVENRTRKEKQANKRESIEGKKVHLPNATSMSQNP